MDTWKHGRYIDLWSIVHFFTGFLIGTGLFWLGFSFLWAFGIATVLVILWEVYEWLLKIIEVTPNVILDIVIGLAGFLCGAYWHYGLGMPVTLPFTGTVIALTALLSLWGFSDLISRGFR